MLPEVQSLDRRGDRGCSIVNFVRRNVTGFFAAKPNKAEMLDNVRKYESHPVPSCGRPGLWRCSASVELALTECLGSKRWNH